jgi:hypothetical protein
VPRRDVIYPLEGVDINLSMFAAMLQELAIRILVRERQDYCPIPGLANAPCLERNWGVRTIHARYR